MSQHALLLGVRDWLRSALALDQATCELMADGQPPPAAGQRFVAVHAGGGWANGANESLDESHGFRVTVTDRVADAPQDRQGPDRLYLQKAGLVGFCEDVRAVLHSSYEVVDAANGYVDDPDNEFVEPPRFAAADNGGDPLYRGGDWFGAGPGWGDDRMAGLSMTLSFRDARRVQAIENCRGKILDRLRTEGRGFVLLESGGFLLVEAA